MRFYPHGERVLLKPDAAKDKTASGLVLPTAEKKMYQTGTVVEAGEGLDFEKGLSLAWPTSKGIDIEMGGEKLVLVDAEDILGRILPDVPVEANEKG